MKMGFRVRRVTRSFGLALAVCAALTLGAAASASAGTLDQQQTSSNTNAGIHSGVSGAQTFTAGITGGLDQADLLLSTANPIPEPLIVEIRNAPEGSPGTSVLASGSIPNSALGPDPPAFVPVTFATPAAVTAGTQYALVAYTTHVGNDALGWYYQIGGDPYFGGAFFATSDPVPPQGNWNDQPDRDFAFKTYVAPPPTNPVQPKKKKCKKKKKQKRSAESAKKKKCKKKKKR
jgi:hypothetical protein